MPCLITNQKISTRSNARSEYSYFEYDSKKKVLSKLT